MRMSLFIEKGDKTKFLHKNNIGNVFTISVNRFRQQKNNTQLHEG
jgi:hypothetical protein